MSFCTVHQTPLGARGCPQCLREEALSHRTDSRYLWRWAALVCGALVALAASAVAVHLKLNRAPDLRLDPAPFRAAMEKTETALYADLPAVEERMALREGLMEFYTTLYRRPRTPGQQRALKQYERICSFTPLMVEDGDFDIVPVRREWEALRQANFLDAPWFRTSSIALEQAQASGPARGIPTDTDRYQAAIDQLRLLNARVEVDGAGGDLQRDVDRMKQEMPKAFVGMEPHWRRAYDDLQRALSGVRRGRARALIDQAQASLDAAPR